MNWGVRPMLYDGEPRDDARISFAIWKLREMGLVKEGDNVIITHGHDPRAGGTNLIRVVTI